MTPKEGHATTMGFSLIPNKPFTYSLKRHQKEPEGARPTFQLRYMSSRLFSEIAALLQRDGEKAFFVCVAAGLVGWSGMTRDGEPFEFKPAIEKRVVHGVVLEGGASTESVEALPYFVIVELAEQIIESNTLDRDSAKN